MRIGKPQSKRVPVRLRHKIEKASASKQRKQRKEAKKNPQWRSRLKKDPGIPNLFPYKAKVLAEIEVNKRKKEEEAQRRRDIAKAQRLGKTLPEVQQNGVEAEPEDDEDADEVLLDQDEDEDINEEDVMDEQEDGNPMAALLASAQARADAYQQDQSEEDLDDEDDEEWTGIAEESKLKPALRQDSRKALPKQALADPVKAVSALLERMQQTTDGIQRLLDHYQIPPLITTGTDMTSSFLVEVARKRGRLGRGGVPNLHSAALTVLGDLNDERLQLPAVESTTETKRAKVAGKGEVQIVSQMAKPFRIEGLWGDGTDGEVVTEKMAVET